MLAASGVGSNVPPQNLQTAPLRAVAAVATQGLCENAAALVANANPAQVAQHEAARQEAGMQPVAALIS